MYDVIIVGAGPAGLTSAIYAGRSRLKTMVLEKSIVGGQLMLTENIENFPGFVGGISSQDLIDKMHKQAEDFGAEFKNEEVKKITLESDFKQIHTSSNKYQTKSIIIATGAHYKRLGVPGEDRLIGRGVSYCATCDGPLFKDKVVAVIGGGNTAATEALFLAKFAKIAYLVHRRDKLRATKILEEYMVKTKKIKFILKTVVTEILGKDRLQQLKLKEVNSGKEELLNCDGMFVFVGLEPNTKFLAGLVNLDSKGYIITDEQLQTSVNGIFTAGDCRLKTLRQVVTACADGAIAAFSAESFLSKL